MGMMGGRARGGAVTRRGTRGRAGETGAAVTGKLCMNQINFMDRIKKRKEWRLAVKAATRKTGHFPFPRFLLPAAETRPPDQRPPWA